ncbi:MAG: MFS transporter [Halieaceae bacterium]|nr:MFS transporter [Halieaceae bacterium]
MLEVICHEVAHVPTSLNLPKAHVEATINSSTGNSSTGSSLADDLYSKLVNEEDARVCKEISEDACRETPRNFLLILISNGFTKLGDALASPKTLLPWMAASIAVPPWMIGLLVPIRESGSLLPQLAIAGFIRRLPVRKWVWVIGSLLQAGAVFLLVMISMTLSGAVAGYAIIASLVLFSLARGFCSVASKDVLGKTVPKSRRGQLTGWSSSAAGLVTVSIAAVLLVLGGRGDLNEFYAQLLLVAGCLWLVAALVYSQVVEYSGETDGGGNAGREALQRLALLKTDVDFRNFIIARALLMCSALSAPFYVLMAQERAGSAPALLALFLLASGAASLVSGPVWGRFADVSSRRVMAIAAALTSASGLVLVLTAWLAPSLLEPLWTIPVLYFLLSIAHSGVRVGRKTYVVDLASGNRRTDYVAVSNTLIGVLLLVAGSVGALSAVIGVTGVVAVLSGMGALGSLLCLALREA